MYNIVCRQYLYINTCCNQNYVLNVCLIVIVNFGGQISKYYVDIAQSIGIYLILLQILQIPKVTG